MKPPIFRRLLRKLPVMLIGAVSGTAAGWLLREAAVRSSGAAGASSANYADHRSSTPQPQSFDAAPKNTMPDVAPEDATVTSLLKLLCAADIAPARDMHRLLLAARSQHGVVPFLAARWAELDAPQMFETLRAERGARPLSSDPAVRKALFDAWLAKDKDAALAALDDDNALPGLYTQRRDAAIALNKTDPLRGLRQILQWRIHNLMDAGGVGIWEIPDPRAAAEMANEIAAKTPYNGTAEHVWIDIGRAWSRTDPVAAMQWAMQHEGAHVRALTHVSMLFWEDRDATAAAAWAATVTDPVMRVKLQLPPLPLPETEPVLPGR